MGVKKIKTANQLAYEKELKKLKNRIKTAEKAGYIFPENFIPEKPTKVYKKDIQQLSKLKGNILRRKAEFFVDKRTGETFTGSEGIKIQSYRTSLKAKETKHRKQLIRDADEYGAERFGYLSKEESNRMWERFFKLSEEEQSEIRDLFYDSLSEQQKTELYHRIKRENELEREHEREYDRTVPEAEPTDPWDDYSFPPSEVDNVLANIEEQLNRWSPSPNWTPSLAGVKENDKNIVQSMYEGALSEYGREGLAQILQSKASQINSLLGEILYASGDKEGNFKDGNTRVNFDINLFASLLNDKPLSIHQSERLTELAESMELNN